VTTVTDRGFTLIEFLLGLTLISVIIVGAFGFFARVQGLFFKMKDAVESSQDALSGLDKIRIDLLRAGAGLARAGELGLVESLTAAGGRLTIRRAENTLRLRGDVAAGSVQFEVDSADNLKAGTDACILGPDAGETLTILRVDGEFVTAGAPLQKAYDQDSALVLALEQVTYYLDAEDSVLRRRVDGGAGQPLIEGVDSAGFAYDPGANLASLTFALASHKERTYDLCVFPKNIGLSTER
jgi:prepilin-type N-terminal cleavage/methylation domain-containing protein